MDNMIQFQMKQIVRSRARLSMEKKVMGSLLRALPKEVLDEISNCDVFYRTYAQTCQVILQALDPAEAIRNYFRGVWTRQMSEYSGETSLQQTVQEWSTFQGMPLTMTVTIHGVGLAPGCTLVPYQDTVTRYKVECPEGETSGEPDAS